MKVLIVYAHPNPQSFNHAILESFSKGLKDTGHSFEVSDLYAMKFDPCFKLADFAQYEGKPMPDDVLEQQKRVAEAEGLVFIYPIWWYDYPAILKGWIDRVLSHGFAYKMAEKGIEGLLKDKKVLLINTALADEAHYKTGIENAMQTVMVHAGLKDVCGIQNAEHTFFYGVGAVDKEILKKYLETAYRLGKEF